jgi:hypothetical protein
VNIELHEPRDNAKRIVPYHTGKIAIGCAWTPPKTATYASPGSYYRPQESRLWWWCVWGAFVFGILYSVVTR